MTDRTLSLPLQGVKNNVKELDKISQKSINYYLHDTSYYFQAQVFALGFSFSVHKMRTTSQIVIRIEYMHEKNVANTCYTMVLHKYSLPSCFPSIVTSTGPMHSMYSITCWSITWALKFLTHSLFIYLYILNLVRICAPVKLQILSKFPTHKTIS